MEYILACDTVGFADAQPKGTKQTAHKETVPMFVGLPEGTPEMPPSAIHREIIEFCTLVIKRGGKIPANKTEALGGGNTISLQTRDVYITFYWRARMW